MAVSTNSLRGALLLGVCIRAAGFWKPPSRGYPGAVGTAFFAGIAMSTAV